MAPDLENLALTDLEELTDIEGTDLLHVNRGGNDYKETFENITKPLVKTVVLTDNIDITDQVSALPDGYYTGELASYGHQAATGMPADDSFWVFIEKSGDNARIEATGITDNGKRYFITKSSNGWEASWTLEPTRTEVSSMATSLTNGTVKYHTFANDTALTTQADTLMAVNANMVYFGKCNAYGHQVDTGAPMNDSGYVTLYIYSNNYSRILFEEVDGNAKYELLKVSGTWQSTWTRLPSRNDITNLEAKIVNIGTINGDGSVTFTGSNGARAIIAVIATDANRVGLWAYFVGSSGNSAYMIPLGTIGNKLSTSVSAPSATITSTAGSSYIQDVVAIVFTGTVTAST